jgi:hypothetical protein
VITINVITDTVKARISAPQIEAHTPSMPHICGRNIRNGNRKISWRVRERNIEIEGLPIDWK